MGAALAADHALPCFLATKSGVLGFINADESVLMALFPNSSALLAIALLEVAKITMTYSYPMGTTFGTFILTDTFVHQ